MHASLIKIAVKASCFLGVLGSVASPTPLLAATSLPCIKEICIGDGLDRLREIDWQPINYSLKRLERMSKSERARRAKTYRGLDGETPSYLILREFDSDLLDDMARVKVACGRNELVGTFISDGGNKTNVHVSLMPSDASGTMTWRVKAISRRFQGLEDRAQVSQVHQELNARYGKFTNPKPGEVGYLFVPLGKEAVMTLNWTDSQSSLGFGKHGLCESANKINID